MKNDINNYLIFKLDDEYSEYENHLISVPPYEIIINNLCLESYEYFGEKSKVLGLRVRHIFLYFNADRLMKVELRYRGNKIKQLKEKIEELENINLPFIMFLKLSFEAQDNETVLIYQNRILLSEIHQKAEI